MPDEHIIFDDPDDIEQSMFKDAKHHRALAIELFAGKGRERDEQYSPPDCVNAAQTW